jgi:glycine dehydrogenase subunit 1
VHPQYRAVLRTYARGLDVAVDELPLAADGTTDVSQLEAALADQRYAAVVVQSPNFFGAIDALAPAAVAAIKATKTLLIGVTAEALALAALAPPSSWGVDIAVGEGQSFGNAIAYGGPHVGFIAARDEQLRRIPGRLVGRTVDTDGRTAYVLTLQAREQHIRREKATSNICTNQAHCALVATIYLAALGKTGLRDVAAHNLAKTAELRAAVTAVEGVSLRFAAPSFNELVVRVPLPAASVLAGLQARGVIGGLDLGRFYPELADCILMNATELTTSAQIAQLAGALGEIVRDAVARV